MKSDQSEPESWVIKSQAVIQKICKIKINAVPWKRYRVMYQIS